MTLYFLISPKYAANTQWCGPHCHFIPQTFLDNGFDILWNVLLHIRLKTGVFSTALFINAQVTNISSFMKQWLLSL